MSFALAMAWTLEVCSSDREHKRIFLALEFNRYKVLSSSFLDSCINEVSKGIKQR